MSRGPNEKAVTACELYKSGKRLIEIAKELDVPAGTVRRWKSTYAWDGERNSERSDKKKASVRKEVKKGKKEKKLVAEEVKSVIQNTELTDKQRLFCIYYIRCFNATRAYLKAYKCSYENAMVEGCKLLKNPKVKEEILHLKQNRLNREFFSEEDLFQKYMDIAFADITDFIEFGNKEMKVFNPSTKKLEKMKISYVNINNSSEVDGTLISEVSQGKDGLKVKLADRMRAFQWLSDHMDLATEEQRARIEKMRTEAECFKRSSAENENREVDDWIDSVMVGMQKEDSDV